MLKRAAPLLLALLPACSGVDSSSEAVPSDTAAPREVAVAPGDPWVVTTGGIGALHAGMTTAEAGTALGAPLPAVASGECEMMRVPGAPGEVYLMVVADTVVRFDVRDSTIATAAGARLGDSEARVRGLYPASVRSEPHKYTSGRYLIVTAPDDTLRRLVFETDSAGAVTTFRSGRVPEVEWVEGCS